MNKSKNTTQRSFPRGFIMSLAAVAAVCYGIAWYSYSTGVYHYDAYVEAYTACVNDPLFAAKAPQMCKSTPLVREHLAAHNSAYDRIAPFLSFAFSVTVAVLFSPLTHRGSRWVDDRLADTRGAKTSPIAAS